KKTPRLAHIPIVLLTGAFEPIDQARAAAVGCDAVLTKPFEPQLVIGRVKELLARPKQAQGPPEREAVPDSENAREGMCPFEHQPLNEGAAAEASDVDSYFDRLDRAFARLSSSSDAESTTTGTASTQTAPVPLSYTPSTSTREIPPPRPMPSLADAFAALLAA